MFDSENGDFDIQKKHINDKGYYVITAGLTNNGILGKTDVKSKIFDKNTITIDMFGNSFFRYFKYKMVTHARVFSIIPKFNINYKQGLFIVNSLNFLTSKFGYENMCSWTKIKEYFIKLPTKNDKIDFEFMEAYISELEEERISELEEERISELEEERISELEEERISELEEERISELEEERISELTAYLKVSGLANYELSSEEKEAIENISLIKWEEKFVTGENGIFNVKNTKNILSSEIIPNSGKTPYLCASSDNNSVSSYISYKESLKDKGNCIFIGGKTFVVSYQDTDFFSNDSHNLALYLKQEDKADKINQLFLSTCIRKSLGHKYSWGDSISNKKIQKDKVMLPIKNYEIDFDIMNTLISAVQKLVIKDVVDYANNKIAATKNIVENNK